MRTVPIFLAGVAVLIGVSGWSAATEEPQQKASAPMSSKTMFYRLLARKPAATIEDAIRAIARDKGGSQELMPLADEMASLDKVGVHFPKAIVKRKDETLTMGSAAHMLMKAMGIKGKSFMYNFFPDKQRYALKEAVDMGIIPPNSFLGQTLSGNDLLGLLVRIKEINEQQKAAAADKK